MDAHLFRLFAKASQPYLQDCLIEKIQQPYDGLLTLNLYAHGAKKQLNWSFKRGRSFCFLSETRLTAQKSPSAVVMRLRKYFNNHRISSVVFQYCQRKLWLLASGGKLTETKVPWLCLDFATGPTLHFLDALNAPAEDNPSWPKPDELISACENWRDWPVLTPRLRKNLTQLELPEQWALIEDLRSANGTIFLYTRKTEKDDFVQRISAWPEACKPDENCLEYYPEDWLEGFAKAGNDLVWHKIHDKEEEKLLTPTLKRLAKLRKILGKLEDDEKRLKGMAALEAYGKILCENLWRFETDTRLSELITGEGDEVQKVVLNEKFNLRENMERFFHEAKRGKRGLKMLEERKKALLEEISLLEQKGTGDRPLNRTDSEERSKTLQNQGIPLKLAVLQRSLPKNVQALISTDGHVLLRGKDAKGNRAVLKLASAHDLWAHVETGQGAHVVIRLNYPGEDVAMTTLAEAASLAAVKSWHKDVGSCSVMFAEVRHVKPAKHGAPGKVFIDKLAKTDIFPIDPDIEKKLLQNGGIEKKIGLHSSD